MANNEAPFGYIEHYKTAKKAPRRRVAVALGRGFHFAPDGKPMASVESAENALVAAMTYHIGNSAKVVLSGGQTSRKTMQTEADAMRQFLETYDNGKLSVPAEDLLLETDSFTTRGNAICVRELLDQTFNDKGGRSVPLFLISSRPHLTRAIPMFQAQGMNNIMAMLPEKNLLELVPEFAEEVRRYRRSLRAAVTRVVDEVAALVTLANPSGTIVHAAAMALREKVNL